MKKLLPAVIGLAVLILAGGGFYFFRQNQLKNTEKKTIAPPPSVKKVNELEFSKRPYVALLPHPDASQCSGVDLVIEDLKNSETLAEYEMEYNAGPLIQGVFGRRDFTLKTASHQPLLFGSCSRNKCKCDTDITGGSLTLNFTTPSDEYSLKTDYRFADVGTTGTLASTDARLQLDPGTALAKGTQLIIMKSMGLSGDVNGDILAGPYGIYAPTSVVPKGKLTATLQASEEGKLLFWDGKRWQDLAVTQEDGKYTASLTQLGVLVLVK